MQKGTKRKLRVQENLPFHRLIRFPNTLSSFAGPINNLQERMMAKFRFFIYEKWGIVKIQSLPIEVKINGFYWLPLLTLAQSIAWVCHMPLVYKIEIVTRQILLQLIEHCWINAPMYLWQWSKEGIIDCRKVGTYMLKPYAKDFSELVQLSEAVVVNHNVKSSGGTSG